MNRLAIPVLVLAALCALSAPAAPEDASPGTAASVAAKTRYTVDDFGIVSVVDSWSGLPEESGTFVYISASKELGRIPVRVKDHKFTISFATRSYLIEDPDDPSALYFRTPTFIFEGGSLSVSVTLVLSSRLSFVEAISGSPAPTSVDGQTLTWDIADGNGTTILCKLKRNNPFLVPGEGGPQFNPGILPSLAQEDIPANADQVLRELETVIMVAEREGNTDEEFIKLLRKDLAKLYYLFYIYGLVTDYAPAEAPKEGG